MEAEESLKKLQRSDPSWFCTPRGVLLTAAFCGVVTGLATLLEGLDLSAAWRTFQ
jgi:hypothetical protein